MQNYPLTNGTHSVGECSSSTSLSSQQDVEDDHMIAVALSEEFAKLDGSVARKLSNLAPVAVRFLPFLRRLWFFDQFLWRESILGFLLISNLVSSITYLVTAIHQLAMSPENFS